MFLLWQTSQGTSLRLASRPWLISTGEYGGSGPPGKPGAPAAVDAATGGTGPNANTLCGHVDNDPRGCPEFSWAPFWPGGSVQGKVTTASLAKDLKMWARMGHPCGEDFLAGPYLAKHPEFHWQACYLKDIKANPWTLFEAKK